jgi:hypothetical protein
MKNIVKILLCFVVGLNFIQAAPMGAELDIEVQLLMTGQFTLQSWNDPNVNLWTVTLQNKTDEVMDVYVEFHLSVQNVSGITAQDNPVAWGVTDPYEVQPFSTSFLKNSSFTEDKMMKFEITKAFQDMIETNGYLPAGTYDIKMIAWENLSFNDADKSTRQVYQTSSNRILDLSWDHAYVDERYDNNWSWANPEGNLRGKTLDNILVSNVVLTEPVQRADVTDFQPWFRWDSPGFRPGIFIDYRIKVAQFNPEIHSSYDDAFEDITAIFLDTEWDESYTTIHRQRESGTVRTISIQYPSSERELACGYEYVWQVEAREYIDGYDYIGQKGIWGWPESIKSPVYNFSYGNRLTRDRLSSPVSGGIINSVNPIFNWDIVACANEYELWISDAAEDPLAENPVWQSDPIQSLPFTYPPDAEPLIPGKRYAWKVRMNPGPDPSPWSDVSTFTVQRFQYSEPTQGDVLLTVLPTFNADVPAGIPSYELRISDINDQSVDIGNILTSVIQTIPYKLRVDENGWLYPGRQYYWKLIPLNASETMVGLPDDHTLIGNFSIAPLSLQSPVNRESQADLNPVFTWEAPAGQDNFELLISANDDPEVDVPFFMTTLRQKMFQYPSDAEIPLRPGNTYFWKINPLDPDDIAGDPSEVFSFRVKTFDFPTVDWSFANRELTAVWQSVSGVQGFQILLAEDPDMQDDGRLLQLLWSSDQLVETTLRVSALDLPVEPGQTLYYQLGVTLDGDNYLWDIPRPLGLDLFNEEDLFARLGQNLQDPLQPIVELIQGVPGVDEYQIIVSADAGGEEVILEYNIMTFPAPLEDAWDNIKDYDLVYVTVRALSNGFVVSQLREPLSFNPMAIVRSLYEPFIIEPYPSGSIGFIVRYARPVQFAEAIIVSYGADPGLDPEEFTNEFSANSLPLTIMTDDYSFGQKIYVKFQFVRNGSGLGVESRIYEVNLPSHPGMNEQVGLIAEWVKDRDLIRIERTNTITGVTAYRLSAFSDAVGTDEIWSLDEMPGMTVSLSREDLGLGFDVNVYFQITPYLNDRIHGIPSTLRRVYIDKAVPPLLSQTMLMWEASVPPAPQYEVRISADPDFRGDVMTLTVSQTFLTEEQLDLLWSTSYYWQARGLGMNEEYWGDWSAVRRYVSSAGPDISLENPLSGVSLDVVPEFVWSCSQDLKFIFEISDAEDFENIIYTIETGEKRYGFSGDVRLFEEDKTYFWRIQGVHGTKGNVVSPVHSFTMQNVESLAESSGESSQVRIITPQARGTYLVDRLRIAWTGPEGTASYEVQFSYDEDFADYRSRVLELKEIRPATPGYFNEKVNVFARVRGLDSENNPLTEWSNPIVFQIVSNMRPDLTVPENGENLYSSQIAFAWSKIQHADRYEIMLADDEDFSSVLWNNDRITESNVSIPKSIGDELEYNKPYHWRIRSITSDGTVFSWSVASQFILSDERITRLEYPLDEIFEEGAVAFSWQKPAGVTHAVLQLSNAPEFSSVLFESPPQTSNQYLYPSDSPVPLTTGTDYFCRIISANAEGELVADPSQTGKFRISGRTIEIELIFSASQGGE